MVAEEIIQWGGESNKKMMNFPSAERASAPSSASSLITTVSSGIIKNMWPGLRGSGATHPGCSLYTDKTKKTVKPHLGKKEFCFVF